MQQVVGLLELYKVENGRYPDRLIDLVVKPFNATEWHGPYTKERDLRDHWGNPYVYRVPGPNGQPYELTTLGADGKPGGEGRDRDRTWKSAVK